MQVAETWISFISSKSTFPDILDVWGRVPWSHELFWVVGWPRWYVRSQIGTLIWADHGSERIHDANGPQERSSRPEYQTESFAHSWKCICDTFKWVFHNSLSPTGGACRTVPRRKRWDLSTRGSGEDYYDRFTDATSEGEMLQIYIYRCESSCFESQSAHSTQDLTKKRTNEMI